jgi:hypothetical protein
MEHFFVGCGAAQSRTAIPVGTHLLRIFKIALAGFFE